MSGDTESGSVKPAERTWTETEIVRHAARAEAMARMASRLNAQLDLPAVLKTVCEETARALAVAVASVSLYDEKRNVLSPTEAVGLPPEFIPPGQSVPRELYDAYTQQVEPLTLSDPAQAFRGLLDSDILTRLNIRSIAIVPLLREKQWIGLLAAFAPGAEHHFNEDELALLQGLADQATQAISNARLFTQANRRLAYVQTLHTIDVAITSSLDVRLMLNLFLEQLLSQLQLDAADVLVLNPETQLLEYLAGRGFRTRALQHTKLHLGEGHAGQVALERRMLAIPNLNQMAIHLKRAPLLASESFVHYHALPLIVKGQVRGVLEIFHRSLLDPDQEWLSFLEALAQQAAIAIDNAILFDRLQRSNIELTLAHDAMMESWSRALDLRDRETEGHTIRVTETTLGLGRMLDMNQDELVHLRRGALLHDIGKMAIPDHILFKNGPLDDQEWEIVRRHPLYAYQMLSPIIHLRPALDIPYSHHERWDGHGYPRGLKGEQIPFAARVFAVVDVWDALRSDRPYRNAWREPQVREFMRSAAGIVFDRKIVDAFLTIQPQHPV